MCLNVYGIREALTDHFNVLGIVLWINWGGDSGTWNKVQLKIEQKIRKFNHWTFSKAVRVKFGWNSGKIRVTARLIAKSLGRFSQNFQSADGSLKLVLENDPTHDPDLKSNLL